LAGHRGEVFVGERARLPDVPEHRIGAAPALGASTVGATPITARAAATTLATRFAAACFAPTPFASARAGAAATAPSSLHHMWEHTGPRGWRPLAYAGV